MTKCARDLPMSWLLSEAIRHFGEERVDIVALRLLSVKEPIDLAMDIAEGLAAHVPAPGRT